MKNLFWTALFLITFGQCTVSWGQAPPFSAIQTRKTPLFVETEIQRFGLTRAWFNQISLDQKRYSIKHVLLQDGTIFIVSDDARLHAIDAETGATLWVVELGEQGTICMAPAANSRMVAALGGMNLQVFDRKTGRKVWENTITGVPGAGCALSEKHVYLPLISGRILAWPLEEEVVKRSLSPEREEVQNKVLPQDKHDIALVELSVALDEIRDSLREKVPPVPKEPFRLKAPIFIPKECQSFGTVLIQPLITMETETDEYLVWPTVQGDVFFGSIGQSVKDIFTLLYRVRIASQAFSYDSATRISVDWVAPRGVAAPLTYSPQQVLPKEAQIEKKEETTLSDDPFARQSTVRTRFASPQFGDDDDDPFNFGDDDEPFLPKPEEDLFAPADDVLTTVPTLSPTSAIVNDKGLPPHFFISNAENDKEIIPSMILAGNIAGFVVAIDDSTGEPLWKFVATNPVVQRVIIVKNHVYACTLNGGMFCLDAKTGEEIWFTKGITQFVAESKDYIYALNFLREIAILDRNTGQVQTTIGVVPFDFFLDNCETDRIYAGTENGLIQCLHEINLTDPTKHRLNRIDLAKAIKKEDPAPKPKPIPQPTPVPVPDFGSGFDSFDDEDSPFGGTDDFSSDDDDTSSAPFF